MNNLKKIAKLTQENMQSDNPVVSIDAKKRELIGNLYRAGEVYSHGVFMSKNHSHYNVDFF